MKEASRKLSKETSRKLNKENLIKKESEKLNQEDPLNTKIYTKVKYIGDILIKRYNSNK